MAISVVPPVDSRNLGSDRDLRAKDLTSVFENRRAVFDEFVRVPAKEEASIR